MQVKSYDHQCQRLALIRSFNIGQVTDSTAFIVPQWGGIVVLNMAPGANPTELSASDLETPFAHFNTQLRALLGVPPLPKGVTASSHETSTWQLDSLLRHRSLENVRSSIDTTDSIIKLVDRIKGMPVGASVTSDFDAALRALTEVSQLSPLCVAFLPKTVVISGTCDRVDFRPGHYSPFHCSRLRALLCGLLQSDDGCNALLPNRAQVFRVHTAFCRHFSTINRTTPQRRQGSDCKTEGQQVEDRLITLFHSCNLRFNRTSLTQLLIT